MYLNKIQRLEVDLAAQAISKKLGVFDETKSRLSAKTPQGAITKTKTFDFREPTFYSQCSEDDAEGVEEKPINQLGSVEDENELTGLNHEISSQHIMEAQENYMKSPSYVPDGQIHFGK